MAKATPITVKELRESLVDLPDDAIVEVCTRLGVQAIVELPTINLNWKRQPCAIMATTDAV